MKKNFIYFIILLVLGILTYILISNKKDGSYSSSEKEFAVKDTNNIGKIFIADMQGDQITLERKENGWYVNGNIEARKEAIYTLLRTIAQIEVNVPVALSMRNTVITSMSGSNIKTEIYNLKGKKIKSYLIGKPSINYAGNFALMEKSNTPFVVNIPGFDGIISTRYSSQFLDWKSRNIFHETTQTIQEIKVTYPKHPDSTFTISKNDSGSFDLMGRDGFNPELTKHFSSLFENVNCENFIVEPYKLDSVKKTDPICIISTKNMQGDVESIQIYYRPVTYRTKLQFTYEGDSIHFDLDKFYGVMHDGKDLAIIQNFVFGKYFVGPSYFYQQRPINKNLLIEAVSENVDSTKK